MTQLTGCASITRMNVVRLSAVAVLLLAVAACSSTAPTPATGPASLPATSPTPAASPSAAVKLRVTDLMTRAGCATPTVIGTQLYSYETGRCTIGKDEITVAVFDTDQLRDEWVNAGRSFGGNLVVGAGWALSADSPDVATAVAGKLGGTVL